MDRALELNLENTYNGIGKSCPKTLIDSFDAVKEVEEYRQFWRPAQTNIVLLAESHVYTDISDFWPKNERYSFSGCDCFLLFFYVLVHATATLQTFFSARHR